MTHGLSYELIESAVSGDETAVNRIISIYEPYINTLSAHKIYDRNGNEYIGVDVVLQENLKLKLIEVIIKYVLL